MGRDFALKPVAGPGPVRLLLSVYACAPHKGSEHGVGWNWVTAAHGLGHEVWAMASPVHRDAIEAACRADPELAGINWVFPEVAGWRLDQEREPAWERSYNLLWQIQARRAARKLCRETRFDLIHHVTWGGLRAPSFLGGLAVPLVMGPLGGGETSPRLLRRELTARAKLTEFIRDVSNRFIMLNPLVRGGLRRAAVIVARTPETRRTLTPAMQARTLVFSELSLQARDLGVARAAPPGGMRLLFVGRLLYWKGLGIALAAFAELAGQHPDSRLTLVGGGPEEARLKAFARQAGLEDKISFVSWLPRDAIGAVYAAHDMLLFPSLHDSGGTVVLEALARGLPVACLDLGGPAVIVTPQSGIIVETAGRSAAQVAAALAAEIGAMPARYAAMSQAAIARAGGFVRARRVEDFYGQVREVLRQGKTSF